VNQRPERGRYWLAEIKKGRRQMLYSLSAQVHYNQVKAGSVARKRGPSLRFLSWLEYSNFRPTIIQPTRQNCLEIESLDKAAKHIMTIIGRGLSKIAAYSLNGEAHAATCCALVGEFRRVWKVISVYAMAARCGGLPRFIAEVTDTSKDASAR
jgi:hypothetical protein